MNELLAEIRSIFERNGKKGSRAETWSVRLREMLRDELMTVVPEEEIGRHAMRVASKTENPYAAVSALRVHVDSAKGDPAR